MPFRDNPKRNKVTDRFTLFDAASSLTGLFGVVVAFIASIHSEAVLMIFAVCTSIIALLLKLTSLKYRLPSAKTRMKSAQKNKAKVVTEQPYMGSGNEAYE